MSLINPSLDNDLGGSWRAANPTPGATNTVYSALAPPAIRQVNHTPKQPRSNEPIVITAKVTDPEGVLSVKVLYQTVRPGDFIPAEFPLTHTQLLATPSLARTPNPAFENAANWTEVPMVDDASGADEVSGDAIFTGTIPGQTNRTLVRYRIVAEDANTPSSSVRVPYADDPSLNFACFVYDGVPPYVPTDRTVRPEGLGYVYSATVMTSLPVYMVITRAADMTECIAYNSSLQIPKENTGARDCFNWEGAFVCDGVVYDHIHYRLRGYNQRYQLQNKRNMRFRFNEGRYFEARDQNGRKYPTEWRTLNTGKMFGPRDTGNYGLVESHELLAVQPGGGPRALRFIPSISGSSMELRKPPQVPVASTTGISGAWRWPWRTMIRASWKPMEWTRAISTSSRMGRHAPTKRNATRRPMRFLTARITPTSWRTCTTPRTRPG